MIQTNCVFSEPLYWCKTCGALEPLETHAGAPSGTAFQYSKAVCDGEDSTSTIALIKNNDTGAEFFIDKTISYGDILLLAFVLLFCIMGIVKSISDFIIPKRTDFKK
jgi:hypothetical protein